MKAKGGSSLLSPLIPKEGWPPYSHFISLSLSAYQPLKPSSQLGRRA
jgi:hypothetical protein